MESTDRSIQSIQSAWIERWSLGEKQTRMHPQMMLPQLMQGLSTFFTTSLFLSPTCRDSKKKTGPLKNGHRADRTVVMMDPFKMMLYDTKNNSLPTHWFAGPLKMSPSPTNVTVTGRQERHSVVETDHTRRWVTYHGE